MDLNDLLRAREAKRAEANVLASKAGVTAEEMTRVEAMIGEVEAMDRQIAAIRKTIGEADDRPPIDGTVEQRANQGKPFASLGDQLIAVARATGYGTPQYDRRLDAVKAAITGHGESVPSDGGFLLQPDFVEGLLKRTYETGVLVGRCDRVPVSAASNSITWKYLDETSRASGSRNGAVVIYRDAEGDTILPSTLKFGRSELKLERMTGLYYATEEELQDTPALTTVANRAFAEEFGFRIDDEIIRGSGAGCMLGILNSGCLVTVAKETGQNADTVVFENVLKMYARMWARSRPNAVWLINQEIEPQLFAMTLAVGTGGVPVYMPAGGISGAPYGTLFGKPVLAIEQASGIGDVGDIIFADLSQYRYIDKGGIQAASSIHVAFLTAQTAFRFILRNNGMPLWKSALTPYKATTATTLSPFCTLAAR